LITHPCSKKAWINSEIFQSWLHKLNHCFQQQKHSALIGDNCPAHPVVDNLTNNKNKGCILSLNATPHAPSANGLRCYQIIKGLLQEKITFKDDCGS
jgi:hypothetical protein